MHLPNLPEVKSLLELLLWIGFIGFWPLFRRKKRADNRQEARQGSSVSFWLSLIGGCILCGIAVASFHYICDHHGDYLNYLMMMGVLVGGVFGPALLLRAVVEGVLLTR
jgi:hypothetical protein